MNYELVGTVGGCDCEPGRGARARSVDYLALDALGWQVPVLRRCKRCAPALIRRLYGAAEKAARDALTRQAARRARRRAAPTGPAPVWVEMPVEAEAYETGRAHY